MAFVWEQRKLGDITESYSGGTPTAGKKEYYDGNIPFIRSGEISSDKTELFISEEGLNRSSAKMVKIGDILYALYGATSGEVSISKLKGAINQAILAIQPHQNYDSQFLMQWLRKSKENIIGTYLQGGQGNLSGNIVKELIIDIPTYEEQKEIGAYLKKLDHLITLHQRKRMLRKCFFSIDWEQRKFVEFVKNAAKKNKDNIDLEPYAVTNDRGFIAQKDAHDDFGYMSNVDRTAYNIVPPNSFAYNPARINVGSLGYYEGTENVIVSSLYEVFQTEEYIDDKFLLHWFKSDSFPRWIEKLQEGSVRLYFYFDKLVQCQMMVPSLEEQKRISAYLDSIDQLITLHQCKSNFCKKNEVNAWEQRKFGSLLNEIREKTTIENEDTLLSCAIDGMYLNSELFSHFRGQSNIGYLKVKKNDLILSAQNLHLGNCNVNLRFEHGIISPAYKVYELVDCNPLFVQAWIKMDKTKDFFLKSSTEGASVCRKNILWEELYKQELVVPAIEEQTVIGTYFEQFDQLITLHQWECNINENTEGNDEKQRKPIKKLIISEGNLSLVDDMFLLHRMTFLVCNKYILLRLNVVKYKITIIIISNILYSIVSLLIIACYLIVINKQLIILIYVEISVVIIKGDDDYARIRS